MAFNKVILVGNLVEDPELKVTPSGVEVTSFRIAVSRKFKNSNGDTEADFITIVCWRKTASFVCNYFAKGRAILVCGELQSRSWTDKDGNKRSTLEVVADEVSFVDKKTDDNTSTATPYDNKAELEFEALSDDEQLPF